MGTNLKPWQRESDRQKDIPWRPAEVQMEPTYRVYWVGTRNPQRKVVETGQRAVNPVRRARKAGAA